MLPNAMDTGDNLQLNCSVDQRLAQKDMSCVDQIKARALGSGMQKKTLNLLRVSGGRSNKQVFDLHSAQS